MPPSDPPPGPQPESCKTDAASIVTPSLALQLATERSSPSSVSERHEPTAQSLQQVQPAMLGLAVLHPESQLSGGWFVDNPAAAAVPQEPTYSAASQSAVSSMAEPVEPESMTAPAPSVAVLFGAAQLVKDAEASALILQCRRRLFGAQPLRLD